jgi:hypothetical protein
VPQAAKGKRGLWILLAGVAVIAAAAAAVALGPQHSAESRASQAGPSVIANPVSAPAHTFAPPVDVRQVAAAPAAPAVIEEKDTKGAARSKNPAREAKLPPAVAAELDAAESALAAKDLGEAIRRARHSLYEKKTSRASAILTRAFCLQGDLGAAKAELVHVAGSERPRVIKSCRAAGIDL